MRTRHRSARFLLPALIALVFGLPAGLHAQDSVPAIGEAKLRVYATAWIEIGALREEINAELGRTHDEQGKAEIRARLDSGVAKILDGHKLSAREYERITWVISVDAGQRAGFERIVAELTAKKGDGRPG
jgi:hypothetical protein